ncbi:Mov34-domain-containing protein [Violaceomyces palustris]|uniref:Mov34-domain-containing protein n=1 Tax=Violaceomyces palustris TaxID=1673888 RepID=A0ACD0NZ41_9BASI|nr:Mov34-domain-containing protein [Violaceomyces palustris]
MTEGGQPLRSLIIPSELISTFVAMADINTQANLETCALLQGKLQRNQFKVTHLVFPKQTATSDSCTTMDEEKIMEFQEKHDLITLGWIHTHPTQSCFLSSLDLHTHASYQMMLPEAIAIVCSPSQEPSFGLFRLTDPMGLKVIVNCRDPAPFHPHVQRDGSDVPALYTDAIYGHVSIYDRLDLQVVDLR